MFEFLNFGPCIFFSRNEPVTTPIILCPDMTEEQIREEQGADFKNDDQIYAQAFPGENCVRILFQRRDVIREVHVVVPEF